MIREESVYKIGRIGKPHGIKGEVTLPFSDDIFDRTDADYLILDIDGILVPFFMEEYRFRSDTVALVKFEGIDTQEQARQLTDRDVFFPRPANTETDDDITWAQLAGFQLIDSSDNQPVGIIQAVDDSTLNILFEVLTPEGTELLVPASEELFEAIDTNSQTITMAIPEGIRDLS